MKTGQRAEQDRYISLLCCCAALGSLLPVTLYQLDIFKNLPDPPGSIFDSENIVMSKGAFPFGIPDGLLGLGSYSATLVLLIAAGKLDGAGSRILKASLRTKLLLDGSMAASKAMKQIGRFGRLCSWCMGTALATGGMLYFGYPRKPPVAN